MSIIYQHTSNEFKKNEFKTLEFIHSRGFFTNDFSELANVISNSYYRYNGEKWNKDRSFEIASDFNIEIEEKNHLIILHAQIIGDFEISTYSLGVCSNDGTMELIRRFHFDYIHLNGGSKKKGPISHLQYGGKSGSGSDGKKFFTNRIDDWLSEPRLNFAPMNLALLLDMTFCEFHNEKSEKIVENPEWRSLIKDNESFLLKNYYQGLASHMQPHIHKKEKLLRDICYGI